MSNNLYKGYETQYTRLITREDIIKFAEISHDRGQHHVDLKKKLLAHGLLVATLPTKLGGDLNFIASAIEFNFIKGVYEGETITCLAKVENLLEQEKRFKTKFSFYCVNESGEMVMEGTTKGMIWK
ncbi:MAG: dehydratase [Spirochaetia bacterium]|nr:dehydratase [Spirochaetia bacterium]